MEWAAADSPYTVSSDCAVPGADFAEVFSGRPTSTKQKRACESRTPTGRNKIAGQIIMLLILVLVIKNTCKHDCRQKLRHIYNHSQGYYLQLQNSSISSTAGSGTQFASSTSSSDFSPVFLRFIV